MLTISGSLTSKIKEKNIKNIENKKETHQYRCDYTLKWKNERTLNFKNSVHKNLRCMPYIFKTGAQ